ncbi:hypothetical protein HanPSC8_Chr14g0616001 [Helianthus annuus]|nr:hypothetical protein HanPSC8_Chr14g0616001 [Helianthus annuus]
MKKLGHFFFLLLFQCNNERTSFVDIPNRPRVILNCVVLLSTVIASKTHRGQEFLTTQYFSC